MKRRNFIIGTTAALGLLKSEKAIAKKANSLKGNKVAILGGGIGGMSAAHELIERGYKVDIYELKDIAGGKARSIPKKNTSINGLKDLPGEHGFRYFPGFYTHITDLMRRTPYKNNPNGCLDNLVEGDSLLIYTEDQDPLELSLSAPKNLEDLKDLIKMWFEKENLGLETDDIAFFARKLYQILTSCDERRIGELEKISWWDFLEADTRSDAFQKFLANGLTNLLVAMRPKDGSARTVGVTLIWQLLSFTKSHEEIDRVLSGPTNEVWIDPWKNYLESKDVNYIQARVDGLFFNGSEITGAQIKKNGVSKVIDADIFILAVPLDVALKLINKEMIKKSPELSNLRFLRDEWMVGMQFFLNKELHLGKGHMMYLDGPWALTSIHQKQFWKNAPMSDYGDGSLKDILSVDISDWSKKGIVFGKTARECTKEEIKIEVFEQLKRHINQNDSLLDESMIIDWMLDPGIKWDKSGRISNDEPLLINTVDSWKQRPEVTTSIPNFFLVGDYVQTFTDLATMEAACESAKKAVNAIIDAGSSNLKKCKIIKPSEPAVFKMHKWADSLRYKAGRRNKYNF